MEPKLKCGKYSPAISVPQPAAAMNELPQELTTAILSRLPMGPHIGRFRCVCKSWRRLLSDSSVIWQMLLSSSAGENSGDSRPQIMVNFFHNRLGSVYTLHSPDTLEPLLPSPIQLPSLRHDDDDDGNDDDDDDASRASEDGDYDGQDLQVVGCCNGLICISDTEDCEPENLILWNPATSETKVLPPSPFHSCSSLHALGFGFDSETKDYKILRQEGQESYGFRSRTRTRYSLEVYSLRNDSWRKLDHIDYPYLPCEQIPQLHKGKLYWWQSSNHDRLLFDSFDLSSEEFQRLEVEYPADMSYMGSISKCLLNEESMVVLCSIYDQYSKRITSWEIWVLLKYWAPESWTKLLDIDVEPPPEMEIFKDSVPYGLDDIIKSTGFSRNLKCFFEANLEGDGEYLEEEDKSQCFIVFHPEADKFSHLQIQGETLLHIITNYVPSQVSLQDFV